MKYFCLPNLIADAVKAATSAPGVNGPTVPARITKKTDFRTWSADLHTQHLFYSAVEGLVPSKRVNGANPPWKLHGFVADYDADPPVPYGPDLVKHVVTKSTPGMRPTWISKTFSNKVRVVWEFDSPVLVDSDRLAPKLMSELATKLKAKVLLPGYDSCSESLNQYFEVGREWLPTGEAPIAEDRIRALWFGVAKKTAAPRTDTVVPLEELAKKVHQDFPGRWNGDFEVGARGPLFWIPDGIDREGAIVQASGMWCHSTRAGKTFVPWSDIFGDKFIKNYRDKRLETALEDTWFDGRKYWMKSASGAWVDLQKEDFQLRLRLAGFSLKPLKEGHPATEIDEVMAHVQDHRRVHGPAPFVFNFDDVVDYNRKKFLNTSADKRVMEPATDGDPAKWPHLFDWWNSWLDEPRAANFFFTWLQRFYRGAYEGGLRSGHTVIMAGANDLGKSLFSLYVMPKIFGGGEDAGRYLTGKEQTNQALSEVAVWQVDDNTSTASQNEKRRFSEMIKKITASPKITVRVMYANPVDIERRGRIILTTNTDADSLTILPNLDGTILDKLLIFRMNDAHTPWFRDKKDDREIQGILDREMPYMLRWLLDSYTPPDYVTKGASSRYGMNTYHHSGIISFSKDMAPEQRYTEMIELWWQVRGGKDPWEGTVSALLSELAQYEEIAMLTRELTSIGFGRIMAKLEDMVPGVDKRIKDGRVIYTVNLN